MDQNTVFCIGFILGSIFAYTGMGFVAGCITGFIVAKNYIMQNRIDWVENSSDLNILITKAKNFANFCLYSARSS